MNRKKYPPDWKSIALAVKDKADWTCQECQRPCRRPNESWDEFKYRLAKKSKALYLECCEKKIRFVLTTAHLDHDTTNNAASNLKALCSVSAIILATLSSIIL
ncbi:hypothetical protein NIES4073_02450 (plasmid) [Kalymmatonema gypsitolerans NIES-4073]|nr:hypothetical protein NIES4073_02450 [Scytonema sp. NIES-4073]